MSIAAKCDICGKMQSDQDLIDWVAIEYAVTVAVTENGERSEYNYAVEICSDCGDTFKSLINHSDVIFKDKDI